MMTSRKIDPSELADAIHNHDRRSLAKAITLVESDRQEDRALADNLMRHLKSDRSSSSLRLAISGPPGVGKSSFIEEFGTRMTANGHKLAILAIDPSSPVSGGSILGDRTRMPQLSADQNAFIRPSPTRGHLGGVARRTREAIVLCEAAGYDTILVETVGVGQSEILAWSMVDLFVTLQLPNSGDELQGIKRGILELSDLVVITKADGASLQAAMQSKAQLESALPLLARSERGTPAVMLSSSLEKIGFEELIKAIKDLDRARQDRGYRDENRQHQCIKWFEEELQESVMALHLADVNFQLKTETLKSAAEKQPILAGVFAREAAKYAFNPDHV